MSSAWTHNHVHTCTIVHTCTHMSSTGTSDRRKLWLLYIIILLKCLREGGCVGGKSVHQFHPNSVFSKHVKYFIQIDVFLLNLDVLL